MNSYDQSKYNVIFEGNNKDYIIYNTFTNAIVSVSPNEMDDFKTGNYNVYTKELLSMGFICLDENQQLNDMVSSYEKCKFDEHMSITIQLTNDCNFKCVYCYQEHNKKSLDIESAEALLDFVKSEKELGIKSLNVHWFGGEPLLNTTVLTYLDENFKSIFSEEDSYHSYITTNGFLITELYNNVLSSSSIESYQITLDGIDTFHDFSRPTIQGLKSFSRILDGIKLLIENGEKVIIRYNVNKRNCNIDDFLAFLTDEGLNGKIYLHLQQTTDFELSEKIDDFYFKTTEEYSSVLMDIYRKLLDNGFSIPKYQRVGMNCDFDSMNSFMITSDLQFLRCSSCDSSDDGMLGKFIDSVPVFYDSAQKAKESASYMKDRKCYSCKALPFCNGGCYLKRQLNKDPCIPEKYFIKEYCKLLYMEAIRDESKG